MLIDCPNCDAQYNISEDIHLEIEHILQCTNCLEIWKYTIPKTHEETAQNSFRTNKSQPQITSDIELILQEEAEYTKKGKFLTSKKLKISKKDLQKLNLKIDNNNSIKILRSNQKEYISPKDGATLYINRFTKVIIVAFLIIIIGSGTFLLAPIISKHIPQTESSLRMYKSKVRDIFSTTKNFYLEVIIPQTNKLFD